MGPIVCRATRVGTVTPAKLCNCTSRDRASLNATPNPLLASAGRYAQNEAMLIVVFSRLVDRADKRRSQPHSCPLFYPTMFTESYDTE